jgi:phosphoribosylglycinamide formyltransferase-1
MLIPTMQVTSRSTVRMAVFGSGTGTNADAIIRRGQDSGSYDVVLVISSKAAAGLVEIAGRHGIDCGVVPSGSSDEIAAWMTDALNRYHVDIIALAGYLRLIPEVVVREYRGRMFNIHPSLLPKHGGSGMYGIKVHEAVLAAGDRVTGATVHRVSEAYDEGEIIAAAEIDVLETDDAVRLQDRVKQLEHRLYPEVLERICRDRNF